jgi:chorismate dehydratase
MNGSPLVLSLSKSYNFFMSRLRLSIVYYLNSLPLSWGFMHGKQRDLFELDFSPPSRCADLLAQGNVDVGLIPVIEYQRIFGLKIIPGLAVASKNNVRSVLLISKVPIQEIKSLVADTSSRTSVCLLRILLRNKLKTEPTLHFSPPNLPEMLQNSDAALVIGDVALKAKTEGLFVYDLAAEWRSQTGKPFVFAFWAVRTAAGPCGNFPFRESYEYGKTQLSRIAQEQSRKLDLGEAEILNYLTKSIDYSLDQENLEGLNLFFQLAREYRLVNSLRGLEFLETS